MPKDPRSGLTIFGPVNEGTAAEYEADKLKDQSGNVITSSTGGAMKAVVFDRATGRVIVAEKSVLNANGGVFLAGKFTLTLTAADNPVLNQRLEYEDHILKINWVWPGGVEGNHSVIVRVRNLHHVGDIG
jgi:hypothetical protein